MKVMVLKTHLVEETKAHFEAMGLSFVAERHGSGPDHWACEVDGRVLEIYPVGRDGVEKLRHVD
jgi:lactoylglutathione lyase